MQDLLKESMQKLKDQHAIDPKSVTAGDIIVLLELLSGYALGHNRTLQQMSDVVLSLAKHVDRLDREVRTLKMRQGGGHHDMQSQSANRAATSAHRAR